MLPGITKEGQESTKLDMREKICGVDTSLHVCMLAHFVERQIKASRTCPCTMSANHRRRNRKQVVDTRMTGSLEKRQRSVFC